RVGPLVEGHFYSSDFLRTYELETLGLQEDFRLGPDFLLRAGPAAQWAPPSDRFQGSQQRELLLGLSWSAQDTVALGNGFARAGTQASLDLASSGVRSPVAKAW